MKRFCCAVWSVLWLALAFAQAPSPPTHVRIVTGAASKVATYYVATTGNDSNLGTIGSPFLTIRKGVSVLVAGDTLYMRGGSYTGSTNTIDSLLGTVAGGASWTNAITISAYPSETVTITPPDQQQAVRLSSANQKFIIITNGTGSLVLDGINGTVIPAGGGADLVYLAGGASYIRLDGVEIKRSSANGVHVSSNNGIANAIELVRNVIHDNGRLAFGNTGYGIYLSGANNSLVESNDIYGNNGYGIQQNAVGVVGGDFNVISKNRIHDNFVHGVIGAGGSTSYGVVFAGGDHNLVINNEIYGNQGGVLIYSDTKNLGVYCNTITGNLGHGGGGEYAIQAQYYGSGNVIRDNVIYANANGPFQDDGGGTGGAITMDHNVTADPSFVDAGANDYHLQASSVARGAGADLPSVPYDFDGFARVPGSYDAGAHQYGGVSSGVSYPAPPANTPPSAVVATSTPSASGAVSNNVAPDGAGGGAGLTEQTGIGLPGSGDFTVMWWVNYYAAISSGGFGVTFELSDTLGDNYISAGQNGGHDYLEAYDGSSSPTDESALAITNNTWWHYALTKTGSVYQLYISDPDGATYDVATGATVTIDHSAATFNLLDFMGADDRVTLLKGWTRVLGATEIRRERERQSMCDDSDAWIDTRLQTNTDLLDQSGNGHDWTAIGSLATIAGPTLQNTPCAIAPEPFIVHTTLAPVTPCEPQAQVGNGGRGIFGCNPGGVGRVSSYAGPMGQVPQHPDPLDGELLTGKDTVDVWVEVVHTDYPTDVKTTYRRSLVELGDLSTYHGGRKPAGVVAVGDIEHGLGNEQGGFESATVEIEFSDAIDRLFRGLLEDQEIDGDEVRIKAASPTARAAEELPRVLYRGIAQTAQLASSLGAHLSATDWLFSEFGPFGPGAKYPKHKIPALVWMDTPRDSLEQYIPELYGEKSDEGAKNPLTNVLASKGLVPLIYVGREDLGSDSTATTPWEEDATIPTIPTPLTLTNVTFAGGDIKVPVYPWLAAVRDGKISVLPGSYTSTLNPGGVTEPDGIAAAFHFDQITDGADYYIGWISDDLNFHPVTNPDVGNVGVGTHDSTTFDGMFSNDFTMIVKSLDNKGRITASDNVWDAYLVHMSAGFRILNLYGSDLGGGTPTNAHDRTLIDAANRTDVLHPDANWPFAERYRAYTDSEGRTYWLTMIYARGPLSDDHKNGVCTMAVNCIGPEDVGDGTGFPLLDAEAIKQHWLENKLIADQTSGVWVTNATAPIYEDGTFIVRSSSFTRARALLLDRVGGRGLTFGWYEDVPRDVVGDLVPMGNASTDCALGVNGHGQIVDDCFDEEEDTSDWDRIDHVTDIFGSITRTQGEERQNVATGSCDYDPDANLFRASSIAKNPTAIAKYKGREKTGEPLLSTMLNEAAHLGWVLQRKVWRLGGGEITLDVPGPRGWLDRDVGTGVLFNSIEGPGASGYVDQPMRIRRRRFNVDSQLTYYTLADVGGLMVATDQQSRVTDVTADAWIVTDVDADAPLVTG